MNRSYKKDIQLLMSILQRQNDIKEVMKRFGCSQNNLEEDRMAFDLCAFYMARRIWKPGMDSMLISWNVIPRTVETISLIC